MSADVKSCELGCSRPAVRMIRICIDGVERLERACCGNWHRRTMKQLTKVEGTLTFHAVPLRREPAHA